MTTLVNSRIVELPGCTEEVDGLGEEVVVYEARVEGEDAHQQDDVATSEHHLEDLQHTGAG